MTVRKGNRKADGSGIPAWKPRPNQKQTLFSVHDLRSQLPHWNNMQQAELFLAGTGSPVLPCSAPTYVTVQELVQLP